MSEKSFDLVVFGATSFVGQILCRYLLDQSAPERPLRWAAAGRSLQKLEQLRTQLGDKAKSLPLLCADAADEPALRGICEQARVVISTVGPYALFGEPMVKVCVESGTDYCDLTGEVQWIKRMLDRYEDQARKSGARIVHCCGFDSIPSDMGVYFLQQQAQQKLGGRCNSIKMRVRAIRGGVSGGTVASLLNVVKEASKDPALRKELANPYSLCPPDKRPTTRQPNLKFAAYDADFGSWMAPFVMAAINTRIVQRSNALSDSGYAKDFVYEEAVLTGRGLKGRFGATSMASTTAAFMVASALKPTRHLLERFMLPKPGTGPSQRAQDNGFFDLRFLGQTGDGRNLRCKVTGDRDPGYGSTAKMLGQAALCLAFDVDSIGGGFWTPATLLGEPLLARLQQHAGLHFELIENPPR